MPSTIKDVARKAGVSSATVSRALSGKPHVRQAVIDQVREAALELDFHPSRVARSLRAQKTTIIGLIISDILNPFFTTLVRAVEDSASRNEYGVFLCNSDESVEKEMAYIELLQAENVAGVLITPTQENDNPSRRLFEDRIPIVAVDRCMLDVPVDTVLADNFSGSYSAVDHLIQQGHTRIAIVAAQPNRTTGRERLAGYRQALADHNIPFCDELVYTGIPNRLTGRLYAKEITQSPIKPTAIFCGNNLLTMGVLGYLKEAGCNIPEDYALVSFDDMEWYTMTSPTITAVRQPVYELGRQAADLLFERINGSVSPVKEIVLETQLVVRQSSTSARRIV